MGRAPAGVDRLRVVAGPQVALAEPPPGIGVNVVMDIDAAIVMASDFVVLAVAASVTWIVKLKGPFTEGVPEMTPVLDARLNPVGSVPEDSDQVSGAVPPVDVSVCEYAVPLVPPGMGVDVVIDSDALIVIDSALAVEAPAASAS